MNLFKKKKQNEEVEDFDKTINEESQELTEDEMKEEKKFQKALEKQGEQLSETLNEDSESDFAPKFGIPIRELQYICENDKCGLKFYVNIEDDCGEEVKCIKCGTSSKRKRIFDMIINMFNDYDKVLEEYK